MSCTGIPALLRRALIVLALLAATPAIAGPREDAGRAFRDSFPAARFVDDGAAHRYYIVYDFASEAFEGDTVDGCISFVEEHGGLFGLGEDSVVVADRAIPYRDRLFVKLDQRIHGLPVFGAKVIAELDPERRIVKVSSSAAATPARPIGVPIGEQAAVEAALALVPEAGAPLGVTLGYLPLGDATLPAYLVALPAPGPQLWETYIHAESGALLLRYDAVKRHAARVFPQNPTTDGFGGMIDVELQNLMTDGPHVNHTYGDYVRVAVCDSIGYDCTSWDFLAEATTEEGFMGVEPELGSYTYDDGFAEVQTYYAVDEFYTWMRDEFGFSADFVDVESDLPGASLWVFVNADYENGFFSGSSSYYGTPDLIFLGQGAKDYSYDNDVSRHEFSHALASQAFDIWWISIDAMGLDISGSALGEGNADYWPCTYHDDPELGEYMGISRDLDNDMTCPADLEGEGHHDGQVISGALWEIRAVLGDAKVDHMHYATLLGNSVANFTQYGDALGVQAYVMMSESDPELQLTMEEFSHVEDVISARHLIGCVRAVPVAEGDEDKYQYMPYSIGDSGAPSAVQYVVTTGPDTAVLDFRIQRLADQASIIGRAESSVAFSWSQSGYDYNWEAEHDYDWPASSDQYLHAVISNLSDPPLEPNTDYYFSIICHSSSNNGCHNLVSVTLDETPLDPVEDAGSDEDAGTPDAGPDDDDDKSEDGCGCRAVAAPGAPSLLALLVSLF